MQAQPQVLSLDVECPVVVGMVVAVFSDAWLTLSEYRPTLSLVIARAKYFDLSTSMPVEAGLDGKPLIRYFGSLLMGFCST